ncbi:MAG: helix-turn-helix domain-containing protein [Pseudonocardiaceae bacterium]
MPGLGKLIRAHRHRRGWTQDELARKLGLNQSAVSLWENGRELWGRRSRQQHFDDLVEVFGNPEDLIVWWIDDTLVKIENTIGKAHELVGRVARHQQPDNVLVKLDALIEQTRRMSAELVALRQQHQGGEAVQPAAHGDDG